MKKLINIIFILMIIFFNTIVYATTLDLNVTSNKDKVDVDEEVIVTVDWREGMQAADFILHYDSSKFEFINVDIEDSFYKTKDNRIDIVWFSLDDTDKTSMTFTFKALKPGKAEFSTEIDGGFATGEVIMPENYNLGKTNVKVTGVTIEFIITIVIAIILIFIIMVGVIKKMNVNHHSKN